VPSTAGHVALETRDETGHAIMCHDAYDGDLRGLRER